MPDAHGRIRPVALSVDEEKWNRIFNVRVADVERPVPAGQPNRDKSDEDR